MNELVREPINIDQHLQFGFGKRLPMILQTQAAECGLCCVAMIAGYYGHEVSLIGLREKCSISYHGLNLQQLIEIASKLNLSSRAVKLELDEIDQLQLPSILHWDLDHFVVLKKVSGDYISIHDPARGERKLTREEFSSHFTGVALELFATRDFKAGKNDNELKINQFIGRLAGYWKGISEVFILSIVLQLLSLAAPFYTQTVIDDVLVRNDLDLLLLLAIGFLILMLIRVVTDAIRSFFILRLSMIINLQMAMNVFRHLMQLPMSFFETREMGDIVSRFGSINKVKEMLTTGFVTAFVDGLMAIMVFTVMLVYSWKLTLIVFGFVCIYLIIRLLAYHPLKVKTEESIVSAAKRDTNLMESVRAIQSIKIFQKEPNRGNVWLNRYADSANKDISVGSLRIIFGLWQGFWFGIETILIVYFAAKEVSNSILTLGMLFAFLSYKDQFVQKCISLVEIAIEFKIIKIHLYRLADIVYTKTEEKEAPENMIDTEITGNIIVRNLCFRYSDVDKWVLYNINFEIKAGESVAIIGSSGCGKTTLMKIVMGLLKPTSGEVIVNGINILNIRNYRNQICGVMQNDQLLSGSIADNISFNDPQVDMSKVYYAAKIAAIHKTIMDMPMRYNSLVGDMGSSLSGGQRQRVILARAIYRQPQILFLDEATSHLDVENESLVNKHIQSMNITRVIIAHRPETINSCERIIELEKLSKKTVIDMECSYA